MNFDVAIVGGGISGLATAYHLKRAGYRVAVLERQARTGGNAVSEQIGGFLMEHGPSTVAGMPGEAMALSSDLGLDPALCSLGPEIDQRYLVRDRSLHGIPLGPLGFLKSDYLSIGGRLRMMAEPLVPRRPEGAEDAETVAEFSRRRFGSEFAEKVMDPLVGGIYAGRAETLSLEAVFPKFAEFEQRHGSIARGLVAGLRGGKRMPGSRLVSWQDGIGTLPQALSSYLGDAVHAGVTVRVIRRDSIGFVIDLGGNGKVTAKSVVVATQPHVTAGLLEAVDRPAFDAAGAIEAPPLAVVFMGFRRDQVDHPLDSLGFLVPSAEGMAVNGVQFCSTMFAGRAPEGHVSMAAYLGGARNPNLANRPAAELVDLARTEFRDLLGIRGDAVVARVRHWPRGIPQYSRAHRQHVTTFENLSSRVAGLFVSGNFLSGPAVGACLENASAVATGVDEYLRPNHRIDSGQICDKAYLAQVRR